MEINGLYLGLGIVFFLLGYSGFTARELDAGPQTVIAIVCWGIALIFMHFAF